MSEITSIIVGSNVEQLGDGLFKDMTHLVSVDFTPCGDVIDELPPSCFMGCSSLVETKGLVAITSINDCEFTDCTSMESIDLPEDLNFVGTSAFAGCSSLSWISRLDDSDSNHTFDIVGDYAFAGTNIISANLSLRSSATQTFWGDQCFAGCKNLQRVDFLSSCYMSNGMFKDCINLTSVNFLNNHTSYVCPYVFEGCSSLQSITLPSKIWYISEGMFKGCTNLQSVYFTTYGSDSLINFVQKKAFDGCKYLKRIEFPQSLTDLSQLEDGCLSNCMQEPFHYVFSFRVYDRPELVFHGIQIDQIYTKQQYDIDLIQGQVIKLDVKNVGAFSSITTLLNDLKIKYCVVFNQKWLDNIIGCWNEETTNWAVPAIANIQPTAAAKNGIFIYVEEWLGQDIYNQMEPQHRSFTPEELSQMRSSVVTGRNNAFKKENTQYDILTYFYYVISSKNSSIKTAITNMQSSGNYSLIFNVDPSKPAKTRAQARTGIDTLDKLYNACNMDDVAVADRGKVYYYHIKWNDAILSSGMFRLNRDCVVNNQVYDYNMLKHYQRPYVEVEKPESDHDTTTNFETGKWYYNAKDIVEWADSNNTPVLVIYSLLGCKPCQIYEKMIWSNQNFKDWFASQNFYLCGMEVMKQTYYDQQYRYCVDTLIPHAKNFQDVNSSVAPLPNAFGETFKRWSTPDGGLNQDLNTPVLAFRYTAENGERVTYLYTYHFIDKWISQVGVEGVIQCLKSLCLYHFDDNKLDEAQFVVNAGRAFDKYDYAYNDDNPYRISPTYEEDNIVRAKLPVVIDLLRWGDMAQHDRTAEGALAAMKNVLSKANVDSANYPEYIGDCLFTEFEWLTLSLSSNKISQLEKGSADKINAILGADMLRVKIDSQVYILQVDKNSTKTVKSTPCNSGNIKLYKYKFVKSSMPSPDDYRKNDEPIE